MDSDRRQKVFLGILLGGLAVAAVYQWRGQPAGASVPASNEAAMPAARQALAPAVAESGVPVVRLDALAAPRAKPLDAERNLFRFQPKPPPSPPPSEGGAPGSGTGPGPMPGSGREPPPPPLPIPLRFIGIVDAPGGVGKVAVLSDGRGVYHGREGEIIEGRYRIVRIGAESIEMIYLDGRGRQTIRLSGS